MIVREIMNSEVQTAAPDTTLRAIATTMCVKRISGVPIVDAENRIVGMVSEKDVLHRMFPNVKDLMEDGSPDFEELEKGYSRVVDLIAEDVMTRNVIKVRADIPVLKAASIMWLNRFRRIPVAEDDKLVGIISIGDVHRAVFEANLVK